MLRTKSSAFLNNICQWNKRDAYTLDTVTYLGSLLVFSVICMATLSLILMI